MSTALGCVAAHYQVQGRTGPRQASQPRHVRCDLPDAHVAIPPSATRPEATVRAVRLPSGRPPTRTVPAPSSAMIPELLPRLPDRRMEFSIRDSNNNTTRALPHTTITPAVGDSRLPNTTIQEGHALATAREATQQSHNKRSYQPLVTQGPNVAWLPESPHKLAQGKRRKLMDPKPWMRFHPFVETLER